MVLFMTSSPMGAYRSTTAPDYKGLNPANGMVEELQRYWKEDSRCLLISAFPDEYEINDRMRGDFERIFRETGLSVACMDICDRRNAKEIISSLSKYSMLILGGGRHLSDGVAACNPGLEKKSEKALPEIIPAGLSCCYAIK